MCSHLFCFTALFQTYRTMFFDTSGNKDILSECLDEYGEVILDDFGEATTCVHTYDRRNDLCAALFWLALILGLLLLASKVVDLLSFLVPKDWTWSRKSSLLEELVVPASVRQEKCSKAAASFKISRLLDNALEIGGHKRPSKSTNGSVHLSLQKSSTPVSTMERFLLLQERREVVGGFWWAWKRIFNGSIFVEEGVW